MSEREFQNTLNYRFRNTELLKNALTHSSYVNEGQRVNICNNERLEFLGDAIFDAIISEFLYNTLDSVEEGQLTKLRAAIVCERSLAECSKKLNVGKYLRLGRGEDNSGGRNRNSILADAMEAVIGAIYLDGGWEVTRRFILRTFAQTIDDAISGKLFTDYKTSIQEKLQSKGEADIGYVLTKEEGPDHDKVFYIDLHYNGAIIGSGSGRSKKEAEQNAAKQALERGVGLVF